MSIASTQFIGHCSGSVFGGIKNEKLGVINRGSSEALKGF